MSSEIDLRSIQAFVEVATCGSFTTAARSLLLTQPSISARIASLESTLGTRLLDRGAGAGAVATTPAGDVFLPHARGMLRSRREAVHALRVFLGGEDGTLDVGASSVPGAYLLPAALAELRQGYPGVRVRLRVGDSDSTLAALRQGHLEVGVIGRAVRARDVTTRRVGVDEIVLVATPGLLTTTADRRRGGKSPRARRPRRLRVSLAELGALPLVLREAGSATRRVALDAIAKLGVPRGDLDVILEIGSSSAAIQAALAGLGATFVTSLAVEQPLATGRLVRLDVDGLDLRRPLVLVRRRGRTLSPAARALSRIIGRR